MFDGTVKLLSSSSAVSNDAHTHAARNLRDRLPYPAEPDDTHGLATEIYQLVIPATEVLTVSPSAAVNGITMVPHMSTYLQQHEDGKLSH